MFLVYKETPSSRCSPLAATPQRRRHFYGSLDTFIAARRRRGPSTKKRGKDCRKYKRRETKKTRAQHAAERIKRECPGPLPFGGYRAQVPGLPFIGSRIITPLDAAAGRQQKRITAQEKDEAGMHGPDDDVHFFTARE